MLVKMSCCGYNTNKKSIIIKIVKWNKRFLCPRCWYANSYSWIIEISNKKNILNPNKN